MKRRFARWGLLTAMLIAGLAMWPPTRADEPRTRQATVLKSGVVSAESAKAFQHKWGEFRSYYKGETFGTKDVLTAIATVKPGEAVHREHRHAEEEYLILTEGSGQWSLDGKEFPAKRGDILYVEPWVYHGLVNSGTEPLVFVVVRFNSKGVDLPPRPDDRPDEL